MNDRLSCGMAEQMISLYGKGGCTDEEKALLEKHCLVCVDCAIKLIREKSRVRTAAEERSGRESRPASHKGHPVILVYGSVQEEAPKAGRERIREDVSVKAQEISFYRELAAGAAAIVVFILISIAAANIFSAFYSPAAGSIYGLNGNAAVNCIADDYFTEGYFEEGSDWQADDPADY